jgi:hypothetical protein
MAGPERSGRAPGVVVALASPGLEHGVNTTRPSGEVR